MAWKTLVSPLAITRRRRGVATALVYGLSLSVRFISAAGEQIEAPAQAAQGPNPMISVIINDGAQSLYRNWTPGFAQPIGFHGGRALSPGGCRAACEGHMPTPFVASCASSP